MDVKYVVASQFDLDLGATVKFAYPADDQPLFAHENGFGNLLIPDQAHMRQEDWTFFYLYQNKGSTTLEYTPRDQDAKVYYVCNALQTKTGVDLKRGAQIYSLSVISGRPFCSVSRPLLLLAINAHILTPDQDRLAEVYNSLNSIDLSAMPNFTWNEKSVLQASPYPGLFRDAYDSNRHSLSGSDATAVESSSDTHFYDVVANYRGLKIPLHIPTDTDYYNAGEFSMSSFAMFCNRVTLSKGSYNPEITIYGQNTPALIILWAAMLGGKKIIFVSDSSKMTCRELCDIVTACGFLGSAGGLVNSFTKVFPYVDLGRVDDLLKGDGYVAGVTNGAFLLHPEWWDIAVHIQKGKIELSPRIVQKPPDKLPAIHHLTHNFVTDMISLVNGKSTESSVRERTVEFGRRFLRKAAAADLEQVAVRIAHSKPEDRTRLVGGFGFPWENQRERDRFLATFGPIVNVWKKMPSFYFYLKQVAKTSWPQPPNTMVDFFFNNLRLRNGGLDLGTSAATYKNICQGLTSPDAITRYLAETNSIYYLNLGLYHPDLDVRIAVANAITKFAEHSAGHYYYLELAPFHSLALERARREEESHDETIREDAASEKAATVGVSFP